MKVTCGNKKTAKRLRKVLAPLFPDEEFEIQTDGNQEIRIEGLSAASKPVVALNLRGAGYFPVNLA